MNPESSQPRGAKLALSRIEAAEVLGVSAVSIDRLVKRGLLNPSRATRRPLFPVWELERFLRDTSKAITP
jgi:hypothetical protein